MITFITNLFKSARGLESRRQPEAAYPSRARRCYGLTSAIPPGTSFSKVRVGRSASRRGG
jgi:hypothetical protein